MGNIIMLLSVPLPHDSSSHYSLCWCLFKLPAVMIMCANMVGLFESLSDIISATTFLTSNGILMFAHVWLTVLTMTGLNVCVCVRVCVCCVCPCLCACVHYIMKFQYYTYVYIHTYTQHTHTHTHAHYPALVCSNEIWCNGRH